MWFFETNSVNLQLPFTEMKVFALTVLLTAISVAAGEFVPGKEKEGGREGRGGDRERERGTGTGTQVHTSFIGMLLIYKVNCQNNI